MLILTQQILVLLFPLAVGTKDYVVSKCCIPNKILQYLLKTGESMMQQWKSIRNYIKHGFIKDKSSLRGYYLDSRGLYGWFGLLCFQEKMISCACLDGSGIKDIFHWYAHILILPRSLLCCEADVSIQLITVEREVSSANNFTSDNNPSGKSFI